MNLHIRNVRLIAGTGAPAIARTNVQVANGIIRWIGPDDPSPAMRVPFEDINGQGLTLIPGLIDSHEHFTGDGGPDNGELLASDDADVAVLKAVRNCRRALLSGVTSARDVGSKAGINISIAAAAAAGKILGPRIIAAGEWLAFEEPWGAFARHLQDLEELVGAIHEQVASGTGLIKIGAANTRGDGTQVAPMSPAVLAGAVQAAHSAGLKIAAHSVGYEGTRLAVEAGVDSIEHGTFVDQETAELMAERGTYLVPTMSTSDARLRLARIEGLSGQELDRAEERQAIGRDSFRNALEAGVKIAAGTDAGGSAVRHGDLAREIELMIAAGMSTNAALESATREASILLGIQDLVGTVEVGKVADMVLLDGDPVLDPGALRNVWGVFRGGQQVP